LARRRWRLRTVRRLLAGRCESCRRGGPVPAPSCRRSRTGLTDGLVAGWSGWPTKRDRARITSAMSSGGQRRKAITPSIKMTMASAIKPTPTNEYTHSLLCRPRTAGCGPAPARLPVTYARRGQRRCAPLRSHTDAPVSLASVATSTVTKNHTAILALPWAGRPQVAIGMAQARTSCPACLVHH
jgi:hypothetical protein